jgi:hypothetical protein
VGITVCTYVSITAEFIWLEQGSVVNWSMPKSCRLASTSHLFICEGGLLDAFSVDGGWYTVFDWVVNTHSINGALGSSLVGGEREHLCVQQEGT